MRKRRRIRSFTEIGGDGSTPLIDHYLALCRQVKGFSLNEREIAMQKKQPTITLSPSLVIATLLLGVGPPLSAAPAEQNQTTVPVTVTTNVLPADPLLEDTQDSDQDGLPNAIEIAASLDPNRDECAVVDNCGASREGTTLTQRYPTVLLLDSSGSMKAKLGNELRMDAAKAALRAFVSSVPADARLGFVVYGHKGNNRADGKAESCGPEGAELLARMGELKPEAIDSLLTRFDPVGWTPIEQALRVAAKAINDETGRRRILIVSDGIETCGGNPVKAVQQIKASGIDVQVNVVGLSVSANDQSALRRIAEAGGGSYRDVHSQSELQQYLNNQMDSYTQSMDAGNCRMAAAIASDSCNGQRVTKVVKILEQEMDAAGPGSERWSKLIARKTQLLTEQRRRIEQNVNTQNIRTKADQDHNRADETLKQMGDALQRTEPAKKSQ